MVLTTARDCKVLGVFLLLSANIYTLFSFLPHFLSSSFPLLLLHSAPWILQLGLKRKIRKSENCRFFPTFLIRSLAKFCSYFPPAEHAFSITTARYMHLVTNTRCKYDHQPGLAYISLTQQSCNEFTSGLFQQTRHNHHYSSTISLITSINTRL